MAHLPKNLPAILRSHGLRVVELSGWYGRGVDGSFDPDGVLCHHTASSADGLAGTTILRYGRSDLSGPLSQIGLSRNGTVYLVASGRANHAGTAKSSGTMGSGNGNGFYIGIEAMNRGTGERWPKAQYDAYVKLCAVLSVEITGNSHNTVRAHKETSVTGKIDPFGPTPYEGSFDMDKFRARVKSVMASLSKDGSTSPAWKWDPDQVSDLSLVQEQFQIAAGHKAGKIVRYHGVAHIQNALNVKGGENLAVDGLCDKETVAAWKRWETKHGGTDRATTPDAKSLQALTILYRFNVDVKATPAPAPKPEPKPAPAPAKALTIMTWNIENKRDEDLDRAALIKVLADEKPDVVCIQEGYRIFLADIPGYREVYHAYKGYSTDSENRAQAILVRDGVSVKRKKAIPMALSWVGPKMGVKKDPRVHRYVTVVKDGQAWHVSTWHIPFGKAPVEESRKAAVSWLKAMGRLAPAIAVGDWNSLASALQAKVGTPAGAKVDGGSLDKAVFRGCSKVEGKNLGDKNRSDHDIKIWTFKK